MQVLHSLVFDFLNYRTGRLDPSYTAITRPRLESALRTVATALKRLRELGILNWVRRCAENWRDGRFVLEQKTNAYAVLPEEPVAGLQGTCRSHQCPLPARGENRRPMLSAGRSGYPGRPILRPKRRCSAVNAMTPLERSIGQLPAQHACPQTVRFTGVHAMRRNIPQTLKTYPQHRPEPVDRRKEDAHGTRGGWGRLCHGLVVSRPKRRQHGQTTRGRGEPMPGMVKRRCPECRYFFAAPAGTGPPSRPRCQDCVEKSVARPAETRVKPASFKP